MNVKSSSAARRLYNIPRTAGVVECARCKRRGTSGFVLVDRYANGTEQWQCRYVAACLHRLKSHRLQLVRSEPEQG